LLALLCAPEVPLREGDVVALQTFARLLELGVDTSRWENFVTEPWHSILQRYLANKYPRADKTTQTKLIARHVWIRQTVFRKEKVEVSARIVTDVLKARGIKKETDTVVTIAKRAANKRVARQWIAQRFREHRKDYTRDSIAQAMLEQFEPGEGANLVTELVQRSEHSLHPDNPAPTES
jgi:hypothetical protein